MKARPLTKPEVAAVLDALPSTREKTLFILGVRTGFRISEILSLRIKDVCRSGVVLDRVTVQRKAMKGSKESRSVKLHSEAKRAIQKLIEETISRGRMVMSSDFLFKPNQGLNKPLSRKYVWGILKTAMDEAGVHHAGGTHAMRKTFAAGVWERSGHDLMKTKEAMGHNSVQSTVHYLKTVSQEDLDDLVTGE